MDVLGDNMIENVCELCFIENCI